MKHIILMIYIHMMIKMIKIIAMTAIDIFSSPEKVKEIKTEFRRSNG